MKCIYQLLLTFSSFLVISSLKAQMWNGTDSLYGNEWIHYEQAYFKIKIAKDGLYRIDYEALATAGIPVGILTASQFQIYHLGKEVPLYTSSNTILSNNDYIEFYGQKNRSEVDRFLFNDPENEMLNPAYSLFTDTAAYFLTWAPPNISTIRYEEVENDLTNLPEKEEWYWAEKEVVFTDKFLKNYTRISGVTLYYSNFEVAEGYGNRGINELLAAGNTLHTVDVPLPELVPTGPDIKTNIRFATGLGSHHQVFRVNGNQYFEEEFSNVQVKDWTAAIPSNIGDNLKIELEGIIDERDEATLSVVRVEYPHGFDLENQNMVRFKLAPSPNRQYLEIQNFDLANGIPILYDLTNQLRIEGTNESGLIKIVIPASPKERQLLLVNTQTSTRQISSLNGVSFNNYFENEGDFIIISHPLLYGQGNETNWVAEYAQYRKSEIGGGFQPVVIDIQELYDQFAYGIDRHSITIRNFAHFAKKHWTDPKYVLLIGKGREYINLRSAEGLEANLGQSFFLPSFGFPASDNLMLSNNSSSIPILPVGRIAATTPNEIRIYLDKIKAFDENRDQPQTIEGRLWMKRLIHMGGGSSASEQSLIRNNLINMGKVLENNTFGGKVTGVYKTSTDPIQTSATEQIFQRINEGVSIITFFGHSSPGNFDFNIDNPENYDNYGKFPLMLSLGCYSGNIFTAGRSTSERFCFLENKAAIAFGASRGVGFISSLNIFANEFYQVIGQELYGAGIGEGIQRAIATFDNNQGLSIKTLMQQFTLHGDPALKLYPSAGPDYTIDASSVKFNPSVISVQEDSFNIQFDIVNLGSTKQDSIEVEIIQETPKGLQKLQLKQKVLTPAFSSTITFNLANLGKESVGLNTFYINLDKEDEIEETPKPSAESNNQLVRSNGQLGIPVFIVDNAAKPVYPPEFGIIGEDQVVLKASTADALAPQQRYILELDTTHLFNSPSKLRKTIEQKGGLIKWEPSFSFAENQVYYWRISPDSTNAEIGYTWESSSFTYIPGSQGGWSQGHYGQFQQGSLDNAEFLVDKGLQFEISRNNVRIRNKINQSGRPEFFFNGQRFSSPWPWILNAGIQIIIIDSLHSRWMHNPPGGAYGSINNNSVSDVFAYDTSTPEGRQAMMDFIENIIPDGKFVMLYSAQRNAQSDYGAPEWSSDLGESGKTIFDVLEEQGATKVRQLTETGSVPYVFMFQKGVRPLDEAIANDINDIISAESNPSFRWFEGSAISPTIGPVNKWKSLKLKFDYSEEMANDSIYFSLYGKNTLGEEGEIVYESSLREGDLELDLTPYVNSKYFQLKFYAYDKQDRTAPNLTIWQVLFEELAELAVNPTAQFTFNNTPIAQGEQLQLKLQVENIGLVDVDSLNITYKLIDEQNEERITEQRIAALKKDEFTRVNFERNSKDLSGPQKLIVELNPEDNPKEVFHFNNLLIQDFIIASDQRNPILDVTFDGIHIMDRDLVSAQPEIRIRLSDENEFLLLQDTSLVLLSLIYPNGQNRRLSFESGAIEFRPATSSEKNEAEFYLNPKLEQDGFYKLIVQAKDASGNASGRFAYERSFQVINERMISNVLNYPNPFSTSTQFVYTLTGDQSPADFKIQIMTASGRIVKEINQFELGALKIGTHRTDYAWDGTDEFGDQLANGVYLYRIIAQDADGKTYKTYENDAVDGYFKLGLGKLVILR